jgi:putative heme-binding domain-containing protein
MRSMSHQSVVRVLLVVLALDAPVTVHSAEVELNGQKFTLMDGWSIELVAAPPLVERPVCVDFDETGALYVFDSSGSNDRPQVQQETKPNRLLKLVDTDGDGKFDKQTVFATGLSYSQGATWLDGSLYVASPPEILKFTDEDGDGQAEKREVWYDGKTLTNCGNDLHGPYVSPDGWMYWGKGGSGDQPQTFAGGKQMVSKACHVLRRKLSGGPIEVVTSGGMQNIVGIAFTSTGEPIYTGTFISPTRPGWRDGLTHAIYGGVYGPLNGRLDGIPRTGELLPVLDELGAAAPCGIARLEETIAHQREIDTFLACLFNMRKVTRHTLVPNGSTLRSKTTDFLVSENRDFHPTDVVEDADGSILVVDTGGWYKLCCPTSQLPKPDVLGAIYRLRRKDAPRLEDPRGLSMAWNKKTADSLCELLADDPRPAVRRRAQRQLVHLGPKAVDALRRSVLRPFPRLHGREVVWALSQIDSDSARWAIRDIHVRSDEETQRCTAWVMGNHRDPESADLLIRMLGSPSPVDARIAAMALGRIGSTTAIPFLLSSLAGSTDRGLEHALIYAAIEINDTASLRKYLTDPRLPFRRAAMIAVDQIDATALRPEEVVAALGSSDSALSSAAWWIAEQHLNWAGSLVPEFERLSNANDAKSLLAHLPAFANESATQRVMADVVLDGKTHRDTRIAVLRSMSVKRPKPLPQAWREPLVLALQSTDEESINAALDVIRPDGRSHVPRDFETGLRGLAANDKLSPRLRLMAQSYLPASEDVLSNEVAQVAVAHLGPELPLELRSLALDCLEKGRLDATHSKSLLDIVPTSGTMELKRLIPIILRGGRSEFGRVLIDRLSHAPASTSLPVEFVSAQFKGGDGTLDAAAETLIHQIQDAAGEKLKLLEDSLARIPKANVRKGQEVFTSTRALCSSCHAVGFLGARIGPDLTRISKIRNERDLLESILFPSASFVRGFEPAVIATTDGRVLSGTVKEENAQEVTLQLDAQKTERIPIGEIDSRKPGTVSIMPAGLEKQLTSEELADLVAFLMASN